MLIGLSAGVDRAKLWLLNTKSYQRSTRTWCFLSLTATKTTRSLLLLLLFCVLNVSLILFHLSLGNKKRKKNFWLQPVAKELGIRVVPTFKILKDSKVITEVVGAKFDELLAAIDAARSGWASSLYTYNITPCCRVLGQILYQHVIGLVLCKLSLSLCAVP